ncbi:MAG: hypothetical protein MJZ27_02670 [Bacteroidales bacterium]|nr:hypothetical protein [Bacteroidales bacterium]
MKRNFVYLSFAAVAAMTCFTSCIDNEEPASVANLRDAAAIKLKAEANKLDMEALVEKANAAYRDAETAVQNELAAQEAVNTAIAKLNLAIAEAANENEKAAAVEAAKAALVDAQANTAASQAALEGALAALDKAEKDAIVTKDNNKVILESGLQTALYGTDGAYTKYIAAEKAVLTSQKAVIEAEFALADAKLNPKTTASTPKAIATLLAEKQTALKAAEKNLADAKEIGTDANAIAAKCDEIKTEVAKLDVKIAVAAAELKDLDNQIDAAKDKVAAEALAVKTAWNKADQEYKDAQQEIDDKIADDAKMYLAPAKNIALKNKYDWENQQVSSLLSFDIADADASMAKSIADNTKVGDTYVFSYTGTDVKGGKLTVNDLFKHHVTNSAVYYKSSPTVSINWKVTGQGSDGVDIWTATTGAINVLNTLSTISSINDAIDKVRTDAFVDNFDKNLDKAESLATTKYNEESATRLQNLKSQKQASVVAQKAATKEADDKIKETMNGLSTSSADNAFVKAAVKDSAVEELADKKADKAAEKKSIEAQKTALNGLKGAYEANLTTVGGETISSLTEAGLAKIIDKLEAAVRDAKVAVEEVENGQYDSVAAAEKTLAEAKLDLQEKEAKRDEAKKVYEATVEAYK